MIGYIVRRLLLVALVACGVTTLLFVLARLSGDPAELLSPPEAPPEVVEATRIRLGLDAPLAVQYAKALASSFTLDFGQSFAFHQPAAQMVFQRLAPSLWIVVPSIVLSVLLSFAIGVAAALRPSRLSGRLLMAGTFLTGSVPYFWLALLLVLLFAVNLGWLPATGGEGFTSLVIPVTALTVAAVSTSARLARGQLLDSFGEGYVLTARSKGVAPWRVLLGHALPGALPPMLAWLGIEFSFLFSALLVLEPLLGYNGLGALLIRSVANQDFPLVQASVFCMAMLITLVNIGMDVIVRLVDPRLRTKAAT
ncbi:peptide/nickel transport system permease protein [Thermomonospora echinospora]|uniref:Peptide/nickel transport system permease protein n=1 Tax=Thermomonospora echinospora TaxID=1992 RepID=A0A1H5TBH6_9ACTN|nr:ABC transporter permease [Thermomonospora echinospora]SEF60139.1 peptide/nickel transport system permease protein [Thermomonospora echinospora]